MTAHGSVETQLDQVAALLKGRGWTLATAESCTGGWVGKLITDRPGASTYYSGGVIAYSDAVKVAQLGVSPRDLEADGAVAESTACQMAIGVAQRFNAQIGLSVTGVAGPGGGSDSKPVGLVWIAVAVEGRVTARELRVPGTRGEIRSRSAQTVIGMMLELLAG